MEGVFFGKQKKQDYKSVSKISVAFSKITSLISIHTYIHTYIHTHTHTHIHTHMIIDNSELIVHDGPTMSQNMIFGQYRLIIILLPEIDC